MLGRLKNLGAGSLCIRDAEGETRLGDENGPSATVTVHDPVLWSDVLGRGLLGAGEAYMAGAWSADDLPAVIRIFLRNRKLMSALDGGLARITRPALKTFHRMQRNSRKACKRFISAHYDLGDEFFELWLDPSMTYSAAVYERADSTLEEAQHEKYDRLCRKLGLAPGMRVLEIGTGWGAFAEHIAKNYGCHVTTTTISNRQYEYARARIGRAGLGRQVDVRAEDYRDLKGTYDRVVSIEMVEAIGHRWLKTFAKIIGERLAPDGMVGLQAITIDDRHYDRARKHVDFIKRYVFPGSFIPSVKVLNDAFMAKTDMRLLHLEDIGPDYARTLSEWRERFLARLDEARAQGFDDTFLRMWDYYFAYCEGGFAERFLGNVQMVFAQPGARVEPWRGAAAR